MPRRALPLLALTAALSTSAPALAQKALGTNIHQSPTVGVEIAREARLGWVRIDLNWFNVEGAQGKEDWSVIDAVVDAARSRDLQVLGVIGYGPSWASAGDKQGDGSINDVPKPGTYADFVARVVQRYQGKITHYELWNEPNLEEFFEGTPVDYLDRVLKPGAAAVHGGCPSCKVLAPGIASIGKEYDAWMDAVLAAAKDDIDIVSGHIYAGFPADDPNAGKTSDSFFNRLEHHRVVTVNGAVLHESPLSFREVMDKHKVQKPFWLTETGRQAPLGDAAKEETQRRHYQRVLEAMLRRPWWQGTIFYEAFDEPSTPELTWGLGLHDDSAPGGFHPKPVLGFLKKVIGAQPQFGGKNTDCMDFLDNDGDGKIDFPGDEGCGGGSTTEGPPQPEYDKGDAAGAAGAGGEAGAGAVGGAGTGEAAGGAGQGGSGLRGDLELNDGSTTEDGGCAQGQGRGGRGGAGLLALAGALLARRRRPRSSR
jgi:hypothetical protein